MTFAQDDEAERAARAKQLRETIEELTGGKTDSNPAAPARKPTPREFTDKAAAEAARQAEEKKGEDRKNR